MKTVRLMLLSVSIAVFTILGFAQTNELVSDDTSVTRPDEQLSATAREVVKLADANTEKSEIEAYIHNSPQPFHLSAGDVIYLRDLGIDTDIVTSMLQHDVQIAGNNPNNTVKSDAVTSPPANTPAATAPLVPRVDNNPPPDVHPFYDSLAPYGSWVFINGEGWAWQPNAVVTDPGWQPYCDAGHWLWTDCGWYWASDYSWGWAPFHYGRWSRTPNWGWVWFPDTHWGPSWVTWRTYGDVCGWAPLPPHSVFVGTGFSFGDSFVGLNFDFGLPSDCFTFVDFPLFFFSPRFPASPFLARSCESVLSSIDRGE